MSNAFCTKCGAPLAPGSAFCASCGERTAAQTQPQPAYNTAPQPQYMPQPQYGYQQQGYPVRRTNTGRIIAIIAAAAVVIAGIILLIVLLGGGGDASVKATDLIGDWSGSMKLENINTSNLGLDSYIDPDTLEDQLGTEQDISMYIDVDDNDDIVLSGSMFYNNPDATYKNGRLTIENEQFETMMFTMEGGVSRKGDSYAFNGTWKMMYDGKEFASGSWTMEMED